MNLATCDLFHILNYVSISKIEKDGTDSPKKAFWGGRVVYRGDSLTPPPLSDFSSKNRLKKTPEFK